MLVKIMETEEEAKQLSKILLNQEDIPAFLYRQSDHEGLVLGLYEEDIPMGMAYGVIKKDGDIFVMYVFYIKKEARNMQNICKFLRTMLEIVRERLHAKETWWKYEFVSERDPFEVVIQRCGYSYEKLWNVKRNLILTADIEKLRKTALYHPELVQKKGYGIIPWVSYSEDGKEQIRRREEQLKQEKDYLSPFVEQEYVKPEPDTSYVMVHKDTQEPYGWIICEELSEDTVKLRRFYIYKDNRKLRLGPPFASLVLDEISKKYEKLVYDVVKGNSQMERFTARAFAPIIHQSSYVCNTKINLIS